MKSSLEDDDANVAQIGYNQDSMINEESSV